MYSIFKTGIYHEIFEVFFVVKNNWFVYLKGRITFRKRESERARERERQEKKEIDIFDWLVYCSRWLQCQGWMKSHPGGRSQELYVVSPWLGGPRTYATFCCFLRCISRGLHPKWSCQDLNWRSFGMLLLQAVA